jgi:hypothetical protein
LPPEAGYSSRGYSRNASSISSIARRRCSSADSSIPIGGSSGSPASGCVGRPQPRSLADAPNGRTGQMRRGDASFLDGATTAEDPIARVAAALMCTASVAAQFGAARDVTSNSARRAAQCFIRENCRRATISPRSRSSSTAPRDTARYNSAAISIANTRPPLFSRTNFARPRWRCRNRRRLFWRQDQTREPEGRSQRPAAC